MGPTGCGGPWRRDPLGLVKFALLGDRENLYLVTIHVDEIAASFTC